MRTAPRRAPPPLRTAPLRGPPRWTAPPLGAPSRAAPRPTAPRWAPLRTAPRWAPLRTAPPDGAGGRVWRALPLLRAFLDAVADLAVRSGGPPPRPGRPRARLLPWTARWAEALADPSDPSVPLRDEGDELVAGVGAWLGEQTGQEEPGTVELRLVAPADQDGDWCLDLGLRTAAGDLLPAGEVWGREDREGAALQQALLSGLGRAGRVFPPLDRALAQTAPTQVALDLDAAWRLLGSLDTLLAEDVTLVPPPDLRTADLALRLRVGVAPPGEDGEAAPGPEDSGAPPAGDDIADDDDDADAGAFAGVPAEHAGLRRVEGGRSGSLTGLLTGFRWELALGGEALSAEEFAAIVAVKAPLVRIRDRWVRLDERRLAALTPPGPPGELSLAEALALGLSGSQRIDDGEQAEAVEVVADGGVAVLVDRLRDAGERPPVSATPPGFTGELRPYQSRGVSWLQGMGALDLGAVLADEMGLGKTPSLIAHLLLRDGGAGPHLVVCPTSVVGNWERELHRFAPGVAVTRHHGAELAADLTGAAGVVLTTYGTLRRDVDVLAAIDWDVVALDEAQQVKNPGTAGARAVRRLRARQRVALTGTPLENRLGELWSLLDATNPGLLGSRARFARRFAAPIEQRGDAEAARRLRRLVAPFVLRREKRDPTIVADLPDKVERDVICALTPEQAALYQAAVDRALQGGTLTGGSAIERRGRILALLTELKQICNHPAQYLRERATTPRPVLGGRSGKLAVARGIVAGATDSGAQVLCFTQYVEMGHLLGAAGADDLGVPVPFLHGGVPATQRDRIVAGFQGEEAAVAEMGVQRPPPVLVVSLRAGGTGLNLTAATHVVHYDRWWNPAVEDQATDRAHRIGQSSTVEVHKLVTAGTVEERVAEVLERKRELAERVVGAGESWLTELGDDELAELVALSADAPIEELDDEDPEGRDA